MQAEKISIYGIRRMEAAGLYFLCSFVKLIFYVIFKKNTLQTGKCKSGTEKIRTFFETEKLRTDPYLSVPIRKKGWIEKVNAYFIKNEREL